MTRLSTAQLQNGAEGRAKVAVDVNVQAPMGGWNTRDSFDDIEPTDAIVMDNWIPGLGSVAVRKGRVVEHRQDMDVVTERTAVETLAVYESEGKRRLIGADGGDVYDITQGTTLDTGFGNDYWSWANFEGVLVMVNGTDTPQEYDGTTLSDLVITGPTNPVGVFPYKSRMYYWDSSSQNFWYTALYAKGGACTEYPLSRLTTFGGDIIAIGAWTHDGGSGPDDHIAFIMSSGEVVVYQGSSPASISNWALVGVYNIGVPMSPRCAVKFGGDLFIMTALDVVPMSKIMQGTETLANRSKISGAMEQSAQFYGSGGFESIMYPAGKLAVFNVPAPGGTEFYQYVMNLITGAWSRLKGFNAHSWAVVGNDIYYGGDNGVTYKALEGYVDQELDWNGVDEWEAVDLPIYSDLQTSWLTFGSVDNKSIKLIKPIFRSAIKVNYTYQIAMDFEEFGSLDYPTPIFVYGTPWGSPWGSPWGHAISIDKDWDTVEGFGRYASLYLKTAMTEPLQWATTIWHIEGGTRL